MADEWKDLHTFAATDVMVATYFENMRQNYYHIREPRYNIVRGKNSNNTLTAVDSTAAAAIPFKVISTTHLDPVIIETSGRDLLVASNPTASINGASIGFTIRMDGTALYEASVTDGMAVHYTIASTNITIPVVHIIAAPNVGLHTFELAYSLTGGGAQTLSMITGSHLFLMVMEI